MKSLILVSSNHFSFLSSEQNKFEPSLKIIPGAVFTQTLLSPARNGASSKTHVFVGLPPPVNLHAPRLAYLLRAGAGSGARALLSASYSGGTSGTSALSGALSTRPAISLLSGRRSWGPLFLESFPLSGWRPSALGLVLLLFLALLRPVSIRHWRHP